ncbi:STE/STE20/FRAY protein kinase [Allomyces macrogynus ATCC 38327]|uniref:STE/STE20/FRAY protein kinase n=1 Tax=Allomyces macrogynus (strain ATCC 38327) TaxID=578462 RepID=A0A0L0SWV0_ALLM3|nr:STE/STE20/FRAY protein kinase [Allomyces macrogynus ATCC 38327]|eukprot:KNE66885.1 STE/STE20/FRAY protein kinase [Allomyces macrogynus ATCC 38327]
MATSATTPASNMPSATPATDSAPSDLGHARPAAAPVTGDATALPVLGALAPATDRLNAGSTSALGSELQSSAPAPVKGAPAAAAAPPPPAPAVNPSTMTPLAFAPANYHTPTPAPAAPLVSLPSVASASFPRMAQVAPQRTNSSSSGWKRTLALGGAPGHLLSSTASMMSGSSMASSASNAACADPNEGVFFSSNSSDYTIETAIGYGSSASVYSAIYRPVQRRVALKVIELDMFERNQIEELRRETQVMSLCKHPNVLRVYTSFVADSRLFIVTPYLSAGSVFDIMRTAFPEGIDEISIATILKQVLQGLEYLHRNGHIHRDVKAGNILLDHDGTAILADFGVTASIEAADRKARARRRHLVAGHHVSRDGHGHAPLAKVPPVKVMMLTLTNDPPTLDRDATRTTEKLLSHPFLKCAKKRSSLVQSLLQDLPPLPERARKRAGNVPVLPISNAAESARDRDGGTRGQSHISWDFDIREQSPVPEHDPSVLGSLNAAAAPLAIDQIQGTAPGVGLGIDAMPKVEVRKGRFSVSENVGSIEPGAAASAAYPAAGVPNTGTSTPVSASTVGTPLTATGATEPVLQRKGRFEVSINADPTMVLAGESAVSPQLPMHAPAYSQSSRGSSRRGGGGGGGMGGADMHPASHLTGGSSSGGSPAVYTLAPSSIDTLVRRQDEMMRMMLVIMERVQFPHPHSSATSDPAHSFPLPPWLALAHAPFQPAPAPSLPEPDASASTGLASTMALLTRQLQVVLAENEQLRHRVHDLRQEVEQLRATNNIHSTGPELALHGVGSNGDPPAAAAASSLADQPGGGVGLPLLL